MTQTLTGTLAACQHICLSDICFSNSPANAEAAQLYRENMKEYVLRIKATVEESWLDAEDSQNPEDGDPASGEPQET